MAKRNIVKRGDDVLTKQAKTVERFDERLAQLIDDMLETMYDANGVGLAAPQVGIRKKVVVLDVGDGPIELVNPHIADADGEQIYKEGCLSVPGYTGDVKRPMRVKVEAQDRTGAPVTYDAEGLFAVCVCHELDHLRGVLFVDLADQIYDTEDQPIQEGALDATA